MSTGHTYQDYADEIDLRVESVIRNRGLNEQKTTFGYQLFEAEIEHAYGVFCIIVRVGAKGNRAIARI